MGANVLNDHHKNMCESSINEQINLSWTILYMCESRVDKSDVIYIGLVQKG